MGWGGNPPGFSLGASKKQRSLVVCTKVGVRQKALSSDAALV